MADTEKITINLGVVDLGKIDLLVEQSLSEDRTVRAVCEDRFHDLEYGLKLVSRNTILPYCPNQ